MNDKKYLIGDIRIDGVEYPTEFYEFAERERQGLVTSMRIVISLKNLHALVQLLHLAMPVSLRFFHRSVVVLPAVCIGISFDKIYKLRWIIPSPKCPHKFEDFVRTLFG